MQPVVVSVTGTGTSPVIYMDYFQNPFQVSVACIIGAAAGTFSVQHTLDFPLVYSPTFNGVSGQINNATATATWFNNSGITAQTTSITGNYAFPVAAIRLNVLNAVATTVVTAIIAQATNAP